MWTHRILSKILPPLYFALLFFLHFPFAKSQNSGWESCYYDQFFYLPDQGNTFSEGYVRVLYLFIESSKFFLGGRFARDFIHAPKACYSDYSVIP